MDPTDAGSRLPLEAGRDAFGGDPDGYDRARPPYPPALLDRLRVLWASSCGSGGSMVEIGPGTGLATRFLLSLDPQRLVAVEPDRRLAEHLARTVGAGEARLQIVPDTFEDARLEPARHALVAAATSFHWLPQRPALAKAFALLRPGGAFAMWWNVFADPDEPDPFQRAAAPLWQGLARSPSWAMDTARQFPLDADTRLHALRRAGFRAVEAATLRWRVEMDTEAVVALAATFSQVLRAAPARRDPFLRQLAELTERQFGGRVQRRFLSALYLGRKPG